MLDNSTLTESEAKIQSDCYLWFHNNFKHLRGLLYHVPNGEKRDPITAKKLQAMGVVPGIPDIVFHYKSNSYFLEFKKPKTGRASEAQKKIHSILQDNNFMVWQIEIIEEFKNLIKNIIELKNPLFTQGVAKEEFYYKFKVFDYLYNLEDAELILLNDICGEDTRSRFVNYVSEFMNENYDSLSKFEILFTPDFEAIYKKVDGSNRKVIYKGAEVIRDY